MDQPNLNPNPNLKLSEITTGYRLIDLGTKLGNAMGEFRKRAHIYFGDDAKDIPAERCLGIDRQDKYQNDVLGQGYRFQAIDLTASGKLVGLPEADYYIAWDFLEHLPNKEWSDAVVVAMLHKARKGVWCRMPSFEQDEETGEGVLKKHGLRFAWTHWHGHPSHYLVEDCVKAIDRYRVETARKDVNIKVKAGKKIRSTEDKSVVPIGAPIDTVKYEPRLGPRPIMPLDPPVVGQWEVVVTLGGSDVQ